MVHSVSECTRGVHHPQVHNVQGDVKSKTAVEAEEMSSPPAVITIAEMSR